MRTQLLFLAALLVAATARPVQLTSTAEVTNSICSVPAKGMAGAYSPVDPSTVPSDLAQAVANDYLEQEGINNPSCTAQVTEACSQVVAGTNYRVLVQLSCPAAPGSTDAAPINTTLLATAFQPLPYTNEPLQVTSVEPHDPNSSSSTSTTTTKPSLKGLGAGQAPTNTLCSSSNGPLAGGYSPADSSSVPSDVEEAVVEEFLAGNFTHNGAPYTGCEDVTSQVLEACTQVVSGKNFKLLVQVTCPSGSWDNGVYAVVLEATVYQPLPSANEPLQVNNLEVVALLLPPLPPMNTLCTPMGTNKAGAFSPTSPASLPAPVTQLLTDKVQSLLADSNCPDFSITFPQACSQVVAGTNYLIQARVECTNGGSLLGQPGLSFEVEVFQPLPYTNQSPSITGMRLELS